MFESYKKLKMIDFCSLVTVTRDGAIENNASYMHNNSCVIVNENRDKSMKRNRKIKKNFLFCSLLLLFFGDLISTIRVYIDEVYVCMESIDIAKHNVQLLARTCFNIK